MNQTFEKQVRVAVCTLMPTDGHALRSEDVWNYLVQRGTARE